MLLQTYHKSQNITKKETAICRFLPQELSELLIPYLAEVRPLEIFFVNLITGQQQVNEFKRYHLFLQMGKPMTAEQIRRGFAGTLEKYGLSISLSGFRFDCNFFYFIYYHYHYYYSFVHYYLFPHHLQNSLKLWKMKDILRLEF